MMDFRPLEIYCDGAVFDNPGRPGGWGIVAMVGSQIVHRARMSAAIGALREQTEKLAGGIVIINQTFTMEGTVKRTVLRIVLCLMAIACPSYVSAFAQSNPAPASARSDSEVLREILNEIRQLRAEFVRLNVNAQRLQVLLDRMKAQQERLFRLNHELGSARDELSAIRSKQDGVKEALEAAEKRFAGGVQGDNEIKALTAELRLLKEREQLLMGRDPLLSAQLNSTLTTLTELNARLDDLEREIATPATGQERPQKKN